MSKRKKKLNKRIDQIVGAIDIDSKAQILDKGVQNFPGWSWECDSKGKYFSCSPEVFDNLGIVASAFIDKSLFSFRLTRESASELQRYLNESQSGGNLIVRFEHANGKLIVVNLNISPKRSESGELLGWSGFNQVIQEEAAPAVVAEAVSYPPAEPVLIRPSASYRVPTQPVFPAKLQAEAAEEVVEERGAELADYLMVIIRRRWVVLVTLFFTLLIVASVLSQMPSQYTARAVVRVTSPRSGSADYVDYNTDLGQRLLGTYVELANGESVKRDLANYVDRVPKIKAQAIENSELFEITVQDPDPGLAQYAANKIAELVIVDARSRGTSETPVNVYIAEPAALPTLPSSPSPWLIIALAAFVGLLGGIGLAFVFESLDTRLYADKQIEDLTGLPVVGNIPEGVRPGSADAMLFDRHIHAEAFRRMRTNVFSPVVNRQLKSILITSAVPRDGKTAVTANFAISLAKSNRSVCVVDASLRYPKVHTYFDLENERGLCDVLENRAGLFEVVCSTRYPNLSVVPSGQSVSNPVELLDSDEMREVISQLTQKYDVVLIDSPASTSVTDPAVLAPMVDGVLLVVRHGWVRRESLMRAIKYLSNVDANFIGVVSNVTDQGARARLFRVTSRA